MKVKFLPLREFRNLADLNAQACSRVMNEASQRLHGTTRQKPLTLFELDRAHMLELPAVAPDLGTWYGVAAHRECHVAHERAL